MCRRATTRWMARSGRTEEKRRYRTAQGSGSPTSCSSSSESADGDPSLGAADLPPDPDCACLDVRVDGVRVGEQEVSGAMAMVSALRAAGDTDPGLQREVNEDRFHFDLARRLFMVVDGIGGQAAGGKAADTAVTMLRSRLERETGPTAERIREAIAIANNEIYRLAGVRPEWSGMACVLTVAVLEEARAIVGHVG